MVLFLETSLNLERAMKGFVLRVERPFYVFSLQLAKLKECMGGSFSVEKRKLGFPIVLRISRGKLVLMGEGEVGDWIVGKDGVLGRVSAKSGKLILVDTPFSEDFSVQVLLEKDGVRYQGRLIGGSPPLVDVSEEASLLSFDVFLSETEDFGLVLNRMGRGYMGKIVGRKGNLWILGRLPDFEGLEVVGK